MIPNQTSIQHRLELHYEKLSYTDNIDKKINNANISTSVIYKQCNVPLP